MKVLNNKFSIRLSVVALYLLCFIFSIWMLSISQSAVEYFSGFFLFIVSLTWVIQKFSFLQFDIENRLIIYKKKGFKDRLVEVIDIGSFEIKVLPVIVFLNLVDKNGKILIPQISNYFSSKNEFLEFVEELKKYNPDIKINVNWGSWVAKYMIW